MKKYCYINREGCFKAINPEIKNNFEIGETLPDEAISIGYIEGENLKAIEGKAKGIMDKRFKKLIKKG